MLSGEVGYFKGTMQLTHPAFLVLESPSGKKHRYQVAEDDRRAASGAPASRAVVGVRAGVLPDLSRQRQGAELGHLRVCASGARHARPDRGSAAGIVSAPTESDHPRTRRCGQSISPRTRSSATRAQDRLTFDEAVGLQWALVARRYGELSETGPPAPRKDDGLVAALSAAAAIRVDQRPARGARRAVRPNWPRPAR